MNIDQLNNSTKNRNLTKNHGRNLTEIRGEKTFNFTSAVGVLFRAPALAIAPSDAPALTDNIQSFAAHALSNAIAHSLAPALADNIQFFAAPALAGAMANSLTHDLTDVMAPSVAPAFVDAPPFMRFVAAFSISTICDIALQVH